MLQLGAVLGWLAALVFSLTPALGAQYGSAAWPWKGDAPQPNALRRPPTAVSTRVATDEQSHGLKGTHSTMVGSIPEVKRNNTYGHNHSHARLRGKRYPTWHALFRHQAEMAKAAEKAKPPGYDEKVLPVQKLLREMIEKVEEQNRRGVSDERYLWCEDINATFVDISKNWPDAKAPPHDWGLKQAWNEIEWLCLNWEPERRRMFGSHAEALKNIAETYWEEAQCKRGLKETPVCHEGEIAGIRPHCYCECHQWWEGPACNVPQCRPLTKEDFPFTDCGTEDDGCNGTLAFGDCAKELSMSDFFALKTGDPDTHMPMPPGIAKEMEPVAQLMIEMIKMARESLKYGGEDAAKVIFCRNVESERRHIMKTFKFWHAQPHKWVLDEATKEIQWLCRTDKSASVSEHRKIIEEHIANMKELAASYMDSVQCVAGMARCSGHGKVVGMRPACGCECDKGWGGEHCDEQK